MLLASAFLFAQLSEEPKLFRRKHATNLHFDPCAMARHCRLGVGQFLNARFDLAFIQLVGINGFVERALSLAQASRDELTGAIVSPPYFTDLLSLLGRQIQQVEQRALARRRVLVLRVGPVGWRRLCHGAIGRGGLIRRFRCRRLCQC